MDWVVEETAECGNTIEVVWRAAEAAKREPK
jgi:hypothetical protein